MSLPDIHNCLYVSIYQTIFELCCCFQLLSKADLLQAVVNEFLEILLKLSTENERIRKKYKKLARRNGQLEKELNDLKEQFRNNDFVQTFTRR